MKGVANYFLSDCKGKKEKNFELSIIGKNN